MMAFSRMLHAAMRMLYGNDTHPRHSSIGKIIHAPPSVTPSLKTNRKREKEGLICDRRAVIQCSGSMSQLVMAKKKVPVINRNDFIAVRNLVHEKSGITLREGKEAMVRARLDRRMRELNISSFGKYLDLVRDPGNVSEVVHLINAITTNVTGFFRENHHFTFLEHEVRRWRAEGKRRFRLWSAACASGEEPYSMAMTVATSVFGTKCDLRIFGSDLSTKALGEAQRGVYDEARMRSVPQRMRSCYFRRDDGAVKTRWSVRESLRKNIDFGIINLASSPYPLREEMDVIFCRNVMIYFDDELRQSVCKEMLRLLKPGGYLFVGHAESLTSLGSRGKMVAPSVYMKR